VHLTKFRNVNRKFCNATKQGDFSTIRGRITEKDCLHGANSTGLTVRQQSHLRKHGLDNFTAHKKWLSIIHAGALTAIAASHLCF